MESNFVTIDGNSISFSFPGINSLVVNKPIFGRDERRTTGRNCRGPLKANPKTCDICGKVLASPTSYYVHLKRHSVEKPYVCNLCDAAFTRKHYLDVHYRSHTGEKPFECMICHKHFSQKSSLNTHMRVHTGERPYACEICHKRFALKSYVASHQLSHISGKELNCTICHKGFNSKPLLRRHMQDHAVSTGNACNICGRSFMRLNYLNRHLNRKHGLPNGQLNVTPTIHVGSELIDLGGDAEESFNTNLFSNHEVLRFPEESSTKFDEVDPLLAVDVDYSDTSCDDELDLS